MNASNIELAALMDFCEGDSGITFQFGGDFINLQFENKLL